MKLKTDKISENVLEEMRLRDLPTKKGLGEIPKFRVHSRALGINRNLNYDKTNELVGQVEGEKI